MSPTGGNEIKPLCLGNNHHLGPSVDIHQAPCSQCHELDKGQWCNHDWRANPQRWKPGINILDEIWIKAYGTHASNERRELRCALCGETEIETRKVVDPKIKDWPKANE